MDASETTRRHWHRQVLAVALAVSSAVSSVFVVFVLLTRRWPADNLTAVAPLALTLAGALAGSALIPRAIGQHADLGRLRSRIGRRDRLPWIIVTLSLAGAGAATLVAYVMRPQALGDPLGITMLVIAAVSLLCTGACTTVILLDRRDRVTSRRRIEEGAADPKQLEATVGLILHALDEVGLGRSSRPLVPQLRGLSVYYPQLQAAVDLYVAHAGGHPGLKRHAVLTEMRNELYSLIGGSAGALGPEATLAIVEASEAAEPDGQGRNDEVRADTQ